MNGRKKMLPKKVRPKGLYLFCKKHDRWYSSDNKVKCKCTLKYKAKLHISGTTRNTRIKLIHADDVEVAIQLFQQFKLEMKNNDFQKVDIKEKVVKPIFITDCIADFMSFKRGEGVPEHERVKLHPPYVRNLELCCEYFLFALTDNKIDAKFFKFESINPTVVGYVTGFLIKKLKANKTYNGYIANIKTFTKYIYDKYYPSLNNPFAVVGKFNLKKDVRAISKSDFMKIIDIVSPERGWGLEKNKKGEMKNVNFYRPWLIDAFYIGLFAGGRNEETVEMKWSDIKTNDEGQIYLIEIIDYKRTRATKNSGIENIQYTKTVEMTPEFEAMLREMGYEEKKDSNDYIIGPNERMSRISLKAHMSDAFSHYYRQLNFPVHKTFKHLRKTYITNCFIKTDDTKQFLMKTGHANISTPLNHYVDMRMRMVMEARRKKVYEMQNDSK